MDHRGGEVCLTRRAARARCERADASCHLAGGHQPRVAAGRARRLLFSSLTNLSIVDVQKGPHREGDSASTALRSMGADRRSLGRWENAGLPGVAECRQRVADDPARRLIHAAGPAGRVRDRDGQRLVASTNVARSFLKFTIAARKANALAMGGRDGRPARAVEHYSGAPPAARRAPRTGGAPGGARTAALPSP